MVGFDIIARDEGEHSGYALELRNPENLRRTFKSLHYGDIKRYLPVAHSGSFWTIQ